MLIAVLQVCKGLIHERYDTDWADWANSYCTPIMLLITAVVLASKQICGNPIQCYIPAEYPSGWEQYVENYCFVQNTYFLHWEGIV